ATACASVSGRSLVAVRIPLNQHLLCSYRWRAIGVGPLVLAIWPQYPRLLVVRQVGVQILDDPITVLFALDRETHFDPAEEVALHPVGAGAEDLRIAVVVEVVDARVLQEASDHRTHRDVL